MKQRMIPRTLEPLFLELFKTVADICDGGSSHRLYDDYRAILDTEEGADLYGHLVNGSRRMALMGKDGF